MKDEIQCPCINCITFSICKNQIKKGRISPLFNLMEKCEILKKFILDSDRKIKTKNYYNTCKVFNVDREYLETLKEMGLYKMLMDILEN